jgi:Tol biopolymer transport system component
MLIGGARPAATQDGAVYDVALVDFAGKRTVLGTLPGSVFAPRVSPDGRRLAYESPDPKGRPGQERIWIAELSKLRRGRTLPPVGTGRNWAPLWSRDGARVLFLVSGSGPDAIWWRRADGSGEAEYLVSGLSAEGLTPDGMGLTFITVTGDRDYGISLLDLMTRGSRVLIDRPRSEQHSSTVSPDGRWVAYASNETGRHEIWLEPLVGRGERMAVTSGGGSHPVWAPDGRRLYFDREDRLFAVDVRFENGVPRPDEPKALPIEGFQQGYRRRQFDLMPDGQHFLMLFPRESR